MVIFHSRSGTKANSTIASTIGSFLYTSRTPESASTFELTVVPPISRTPQGNHGGSRSIFRSRAHPGLQTFGGNPGASAGATPWDTGRAGVVRRRPWPGYDGRVGVNRRVLAYTRAVLATATHLPTRLRSTPTSRARSFKASSVERLRSQPVRVGMSDAGAGWPTSGRSIAHTFLKSIVVGFMSPIGVPG